jgi:hypothetical protein
MRRTAVGICAIVFFLSGVLLYLFGPSRDTYLMAAGSGIRIGLVLGAIWLSYAQLVRVPWWLVSVGVVTILIVVAFPRPALGRAVAGFVVPVLIALWLLRPRPPKPKTSAQRRRPSPQAKT